LGVRSMGVRSMGVRSMGVRSMGVRSMGVRYQFLFSSVGARPPRMKLNPRGELYP
jgi:hypothetical protein